MARCASSQAGPSAALGYRRDLLTVVYIACDYSVQLNMVQRWVS